MRAAGAVKWRAKDWKPGEAVICEVVRGWLSGNGKEGYRREDTQGGAGHDFKPPAVATSPGGFPPALLAYSSMEVQ